MTPTIRWSRRADLWLVVLGGRVLERATLRSWAQRYVRLWRAFAGGACRTRRGRTTR